tara:strand:+ start:187 stop:567 length:381 start_codon:yes stop_codon:yes gene_type:complete
MVNNLSGSLIQDTYTRLLQVVDGIFYDGAGNPINLTSPTAQVEIDFGALPVSSKEFTVLDVNANSASNITAAVAYEAPTDKDLDEVEMDALYIICGQAEAGSFKIFIEAIDGSYLADKFKINYLIT